MSDQYEDMHVDEMQRLASERNIEGRSSMNRDELQAALRASESGEAPAPRRSRASRDVGQADVADAVNEANAKGYYGTVPDPTPNEHYTLPGVIAGKPTPENTTRGQRAEQMHADHFGDLGDGE